MTARLSHAPVRRVVAHALLLGGVLLLATACRNGRLVFFPQSARSGEPAPMVKVAPVSTPAPAPTPTPTPSPVPLEAKLTTAPSLDSVDSTRPAPTPTPLPSPPPGPELSTAPELPPVLFASDQYDVGPEQTKALAKHAAYLKANTAIRVVLRGHTDATASEEYNLALGQKRAESVRQALIKLGIPDDRVETVSFGESLPLQEGDAAEARASNRRVEFFLYAVE